MKPDFISEMEMAKSRMGRAVEPPPGMERHHSPSFRSSGVDLTLFLHLRRILQPHRSVSCSTHY